MGLPGTGLRIEYTGHARLRLDVRGIGEDEVEEVLSGPQHLYYDVSTGASVAVGRRSARQGHWLVVVFTRRGDVYRVVTVIDTKNIEKLVNRRVSVGRWVPVW